MFCRSQLQILCQSLVWEMLLIAASLLRLQVDWIWGSKRLSPSHFVTLGKHLARKPGGKNNNNHTSVCHIVGSPIYLYEQAAIVYWGLHFLGYRWPLDLGHHLSTHFPWQRETPTFLDSSKVIQPSELHMAFGKLFLLICSNGTSDSVAGVE